MRLIDTDTGLFREFIGSNIPPYAILSHTWEEEEVSYVDVKTNPDFRSMKGYSKIKETCSIARRSGIKYAWIDTCCIDKSSSAELTEAINSMYRWYERAKICYAYICDLPPGDSASLDAALPACRWFTRGWTLQELLAPDHVVFLDRDWAARGTKMSLVGKLSAITGINNEVLSGWQILGETSVAQRMSWAAHRETTRIEDTAYCLLGLFGVNMPLLYGEEEKAFQRLQEEIIKSTADFSIFAWVWPQSYASQSEENAERVLCGIMAGSPLHFASCGALRRRPRHDWSDFSVTNRGIKTQVQVLSQPITNGHRHSTCYILPLDCTDSSDRNESLGVFLRKCGPDQYLRENPWVLHRTILQLWQNAPRLRYLLIDVPAHLTAACRIKSIQPVRGFIGCGGTAIPQTRSSALQVELLSDMRVSHAWPWGSFDDEDQVFFLMGGMEWLDCALMSLSLVLPSHDIELKLMFYATGWAAGRGRGSTMQCTILNRAKYADSIKEVNDEIEAWHHGLIQVIGLLDYHQIPRTSTAMFGFPDTDEVAAISIHPQLVVDKQVCRNPFWRVDFSCKVFGAGQAPETHSEDWVNYID